MSVTSNLCCCVKLSERNTFTHESEVSDQMSRTVLEKDINDYEVACFGEDEYSTCIIIAFFVP